jgi:iron complex transport system permease protein
MKGRQKVWLVLSAGLLGAFLVRLMFGSTGFVSPVEIWGSLFSSGEWTPLDTAIREIRLIRALTAVFVGIALGVSGSALQSLFRNPLADPYVTGVSSGAAVGGAIAFVVTSRAIQSGGAAAHAAAGQGGNLLMAAAACFGGLASLMVVMMLATRRRTLVPERLLLAGVMVGSLLAAVLSLVLLGSGSDSNRVLHWLLGSLVQARQTDLYLLAGAVLVGVPILISQAKRLNLLAIGSDAARRAGIHSGRLTLVILATTTFMVSITVGIVGIIGFLGLAAPHIARRVIGVDWRHSLIASGLVGGGLLCLADLAAQVAVKGGEVPVGIVTAVIGAPFLMVLLRRD